MNITIFHKTNQGVDFSIELNGYPFLHTKQNQNFCIYPSLKDVKKLTHCFEAHVKLKVFIV